MCVDFIGYYDTYKNNRKSAENFGAGRKFQILDAMALFTYTDYFQKMTNITCVRRRLKWRQKQVFWLHRLFPSSIPLVCISPFVWKWKTHYSWNNNHLVGPLPLLISRIIQLQPGQKQLWHYRKETTVLLLSLLAQYWTSDWKLFS